MSAPVCLIENDENGKLCVTKEAKDILDGINEPVVVASVVGLYRTGKSYLMNRLAGQQSGERICWKSSRAVHADITMRLR